MKIQAIIFDLDGVICHTDEYHYMAWKEIADGLGITFNREINRRLRGVSRMESLDILLENYHGKALGAEEKTELAERKNVIYREKLSGMSQKDLPADVKITLETLKSLGVKLAIGSSSKNAPFILEKLGLSDFFDAVVDGNQIIKTKPAPEVFLKAARRLGKKPEECLVVEDAVSGAQAGHAGGMQVACVGDAAKAFAGDYNLAGIEQVINIF